MSGVKALGYVRVSRVGGRGGDSFLSPDLQREEIARVAAREGLEVVEVVEELDASGGDSKRPGWNRAIQAVESGEVGGIVVWNLARFSRSTRDFLNAWDRIEAAGGRLYSATEPLDNKLLRTVLAGVAEMERDRAAAGFRAATVSALDRGVYTAGTIPWGYRRSPDRRLEVDPEQAPLVRGAFERKANGWSAPRIARWVRENGRDITPEGVSYALRNVAYLGVARSDEETREDAHKALVSKALWKRCQVRGKQSARTGRLQGKFLLGGIATCASCGYGLRLSSGGRNGTEFYICRHRHCTEHAYANAARLDSYVLNVIEERTNAADPSTWVARPGGDDAAVAEAESALEEAEAEFASFLADPKLRGILGPEAYAQAAEAHVATANKLSADLENTREAASGSFDLVGRLWNTEWGQAERHEWLERVIAACSVSKGREPLSRRVEVELR
jgi:DNA invertase Pin-like site-specific DNA recombinase